MNIGATSDRHLTYCLNVHPGESWRENLAALRQHTLAVRQRVAADRAFGLGLRLSRQAATELARPEALAAFKEFMAEHDLYVFTVNAFPYGLFHGAPVKDRVYHPDWSRPERLRYTVLVARVLAALLPDGVAGSISTLPLGLTDASRHPEAEEAMLQNLVETAVVCARIEEQSGRRIGIGLEPEPGCLLETTPDMISYFEERVYRHGAGLVAESAGCSRAEAGRMLRRYLGVCFDTCHLALQYEDLPASLEALSRAGIPVVKVQLSAALTAVPGRAAGESLRAFTDPVYLHQVMARGRDGSLHARGDLEQALTADCGTGDREWRIHVHIPLFVRPGGELGSTAEMLDQRFFSALEYHPSAHLEVETYTFDVLPRAMRKLSLDASLAEELLWVLTSIFPAR